MNSFNPYQHFGFLANRLGKLISLEAQKQITAKGYQFPPSCIGILAELWHNDGINQKNLSMSLYKNKSSINKMLIALEKDKMIIRIDDEQDKRYKKIFLTQQGKDFKTNIALGSQAVEKKLEKHHSKKDIQQTKEVLKSMMEILSKEHFK